MPVKISKTEKRIWLSGIALVVLAGIVLNEKGRLERFFTAHKQTLDCIADASRAAAASTNWTDTPFGSTVDRYRPEDALFETCGVEALEKLGMDKIRILLREDGSVSVIRIAPPLSFKLYFSFMHTGKSKVSVGQRFGGSVVETDLGDGWYFVNSD